MHLGSQFAEFLFIWLSGLRFFLLQAIKLFRSNVDFVTHFAPPPPTHQAFLPGAAAPLPPPSTQNTPPIHCVVAEDSGLLGCYAE
jgi:hypothetical protein